MPACPQVRTPARLARLHVCRYLKKQGMDAKSIKALIKKLDANGDGRISREEFTAGFGDFVTGEINLPKKGKKKRGWLWFW